MKQFIFKFCSVALSLLAVVLLSEFALRFLPYNSGLVASHVDKSQPVYRFMPDRDIRYSQDWDMKNGRTRRINKDGFVSNIEYAAGGAGPLLAVVGDSFIEAMQVDWEDSVHGYLHAALAPDIRVYAFGAAYAALAQYLAWAEYIDRRFDPDMLVVNVVANDFLQKLFADNQPMTGGFLGMTYFADGDNGTLVLKRRNRPKEGALKRFLREVALVNYLHRNMSITSVPARIEKFWAGLFVAKIEPAYVANTDSNVSARKLNLAKREVDMFLDRLPGMSGLSADRIVITIDGLRPDLYDAAKLASVQNSFPAIMTRYLVDRGRSRGFEVLPLEELFIRKHRQTGEFFEFPFNGHWNANGHKVMSEAVLFSRTYNRVFNSRKRMRQRSR